MLQSSYFFLIFFLYFLSFSSFPHSIWLTFYFSSFYWILYFIPFLFIYSPSVSYYNHHRLKLFTSCFFYVIYSFLILIVSSLSIFCLSLYFYSSFFTWNYTFSRLLLFLTFSIYCFQTFLLYWRFLFSFFIFVVTWYFKDFYSCSNLIILIALLCFVFR